jgi:hypothetical protein
MCRVLSVSASGFYAWRKRAPSRRRQDNAALTKTVRTIHAVSRGTYGAPRVHAELAAEGIAVSRNRVARVMREANIVGVSRRRFVVTTVRDGGRQAPDLVDRTFTADTPNTLWVADITYIPTWMGFLYLAVVLDVFSRRIVGWSMSATLHVTVVLDALDMALKMRRPRGVIHHSDQGSLLGFKESSQRQLLERRIVGHRAPPQAFSIPGFYEVFHLGWRRPRRVHARDTCSYRCPWGSTDAAIRLCSRWCRAAKGFADRKSRWPALS